MKVCSNPRCEIGFPPLKGWLPEYGIEGFCEKCLKTVKEIELLEKEINRREQNPRWKNSF